MSESAVVRVAASRRGFLIGQWPFVAYYVLYVPVSLLVSGKLPHVELPDWTVVFPLALWAAYWWFNRQAAIWIERRPDGFAVRPRRWVRIGDLYTGRLRARTRITETFAADAPVSFEPSRIAWWRVDRTLLIDGRRYSVYPEGCANALLLQRAN